MADLTTAGPLARFLEVHGGYDVLSASSVEEAYECMRTCAPDVVLLDLSLSVADDHALVGRLWRSSGRTGLPVFVIVRTEAASAIRAATRAGATGFISLPLNAVEISFKVQQSLRDVLTRGDEITDVVLPDWEITDVVRSTPLPP